MKFNIVIKTISFLMFTISISIFAKININTATKTEFQKLPNIGPKKAERIVKYRLEHGDFKRIEDLIKIKGIGKKTIEKLRPHITLELTQEEDSEDNNPEGKININLADIDEFSIMPGIGPTKKKRIIKYRKKNGNFKTKEELMSVKGIGEKIYGKINIFITIKIDLNKIEIEQLRKLNGIDQKFVDAINIYKTNGKKITKEILNNLLKNFKDMKKFKSFFWFKKEK